MAIVTGAGHGIGRGHALELATQGAAVLVNDSNTVADGREDEPVDAAKWVAALIRARGGIATSNRADVGDSNAAGGLVEQAIADFGRLDVLVNNAGIQRKGGILTTTLPDWEAVIRVHLTGTFNCMHHAGRYWAAETEAGREVRGSVINTTSPTSLTDYMPGIAAYVAAKGGVAALTIGAALEFASFGVRVNAVAPTGVTRMTDYFFGRDEHREPDEYGTFDPRDPSLNAPLVAWLASDQASKVSGHVFESRAGRVTHMVGWSKGRFVEQESRWDPSMLGDAITAILPG